MTGPIEPFKFEPGEGEQVFHARVHRPDRVVEMDVAAVDEVGVELRLRDALASPTFRALGEPELVEVWTLEEYLPGGHADDESGVASRSGDSAPLATAAGPRRVTRLDRGGGASPAGPGRRTSS